MPPYFEYPKFPAPPGTPMPQVRDLTAEENRVLTLTARLRELERENRSVYEALHRYRERAEGAEARVQELEAENNALRSIDEPEAQRLAAISTAALGYLSVEDYDALHVGFFTAALSDVMGLVARRRELEERVRELEALCRRAAAGAASGEDFGEAFCAELKAAGRGEAVGPSDGQAIEPTKGEP